MGEGRLEKPAVISRIPLSSTAGRRPQELSPLDRHEGMATNVPTIHAWHEHARVTRIESNEELDSSVALIDAGALQGNLASLFGL